MKEKEGVVARGVRGGNERNNGQNGTIEENQELQVDNKNSVVTVSPIKSFSFFFNFIIFLLLFLTSTLQKKVKITKIIIINS